MASCCASRRWADGLVLRLAPLVAPHEHVHEEALAEALALLVGVHDAEARCDLSELRRLQPREVRRERGGRVDGREVGEREVLQALHAEGLALQRLQLLAARRLDVRVGERHAAVVVHLEALVVVEQAEQLHGERACFALSKGRERGVHEEVRVEEDGVEEAARGQLRHEVGEELEQPLEQPRQAAHARLLGAERLGAAQRGQEELEQPRHELALVTRRGEWRAFLGLLGPSLLELLPGTAQVRLCGELRGEVARRESGPHGERDEAEHLRTHHLVLERREGAHEEEHPPRVLVVAHSGGALGGGALGGELDDACEKRGEARGVGGEGGPRAEPLVELEVDHRHDRHDVRPRALRHEVRPQVVLEVA